MPRRDTFSEYPQHVLVEKPENYQYFSVEKIPYQEVWYVVICSRKKKFNMGINTGEVSRQLALLTSDHKVQGLNPAEGGIQLMIVRHFIAQSLSMKGSVQ